MNKTLHLSQGDKIIAGVCGGLAEYFDIDSMIIRLLFILVVTLGGSGILLYLILWLIMPKSLKESAVITEEKIKEFAGEVKEKAEEIKEEMMKRYHNHSTNFHDHCRGGRRFFGWLLLVLGIAFLINNLVPYWMRAQMIRFWPLFLIIAAILLIINSRKEKK
ncbi:MAG: PspC domain protein [Parcubacteria group bacterium GW2011_GWA2_43_9b]|uniref:Phage shock protein PspC N-terminal domain-containing protein n=1 Tax=Candidatus Portnoybacteria bacterium RIFCSPLOWO2_02_FULL_39_11 TaxID=1802001 RepID=A0A1G2FWF3_9BACT|nr:MAG: PspC domain protein [Parcubacteria group bacterium GW2011_GWA2_43_9b]OGZ41911.1 MAG: hypothetical protein A3B04_02115 [Candidatus Portnoybacteria bacterium RIFCSPLOWO2_02_FULL_39_11]